MLGVLLPIAGAVVVGAAFLLRRRGPVSRKAAADIIERFADGEGYETEWDDFLASETRKNADPEVKRAAAECQAVKRDYPVGPDAGWCNAEGFARMKEIAASLRANP